MPDPFLGKAVSNDDCDASHPTLAIASNQTAPIAVRTAGATSPFVAEAQAGPPAGSETNAIVRTGATSAA